MNPQEIEMFRGGVALFNKGRILEAHKMWERIWREESSENKEWIKGFIQLSAGLLKLKAGQSRSAAYLLKKAQIRLRDSEISQGLVQTGTLISDLDKLLKGIEPTEFSDRNRAKIESQIGQIRLLSRVSEKI